MLYEWQCDRYMFVCMRVVEVTAICCTTQLLSLLLFLSIGFGHYVGKNTVIIIIMVVSTHSAACKNQKKNSHTHT